MKVPSELVEIIHKFCNIDTRLTLEKVIGQNIPHKLNMEESEVLGLFKSENVGIGFGGGSITWILKISDRFHYHVTAFYACSSWWRYDVSEYKEDSNIPICRHIIIDQKIYYFKYFSTAPH